MEASESLASLPSHSGSPCPASLASLRATQDSLRVAAPDGPLPLLASELCLYNHDCSETAFQAAIRFKILQKKTLNLLFLEQGQFFFTNNETVYLKVCY